VARRDTAARATSSMSARVVAPSAVVSASAETSAVMPTFRSSDGETISMRSPSVW
jgi:hypothetical protein